jgi:hypothetical protein
MTNQDTNTKVNSKAKLKLKELSEFQDVLKKASDQFCWAMDFTSFPQIKEWCEKCLDVVEEVKDQVENEFNYVDSRLADFDFDLFRFCSENEVEVD